MPGFLHENAVKQALVLLGEGSRVNKFNINVYRWFFWAGEELHFTEDGLDEQGLTWEEFHEKYKHPEDVPSNPLKLFKKYPETYENIKKAFRAQIIPDAYKIVRQARDDDHYRKMFQIDLIEVDGSSRLSDKLDRYLAFATAVETSNCAFLRLRIFSEHFALTGEYSEESLFMLGLSAGPQDPPEPRRPEQPQ